MAQYSTGHVSFYELLSFISKTLINLLNNKEISITYISS